MAAQEGALIYHGVAGPQVREVAIGGAQPATLPPSPRRAFLAVREGSDPAAHPLTIRLADGSEIVYD